ncbi:MAG: YbhB/YbcL family Raf kinase inhibitor-like protein [Elusimicrobia bacterium]|nr:YbhB/YbcL family Raf kinase inhibitor-like protein [Elusimicrobiota bacterium]
MSRIKKIAFALFIVLAAAALCGAEEKKFSLVGLAWKDGEFIPAKYTCGGKNINPPFEIKNIPRRAKTLLFLVEHTENGRPFTHWIVWNISSKSKEIKEGEIPKNSVEGLNDSQKFGYSGPCPQKGAKMHGIYYFRLYALDAILSINRRQNRADLEKEFRRAIMAEAAFTGLYRR